MRIKCRIALAVNSKGKYTAYGSDTLAAWPWTAPHADDGIHNGLYWVEVEVDAPEPSEVQTVKGEAKEAT